MSALWKLHAINTPAGLLGQLSERSYDPGVTPVMFKGDGRLTPHMAARMIQQQSVSFSTDGIKTVLDRIGLGFYSFSSAVDVYRAQLANGGNYVAGSSHAKLSGAKGCIVPVELSAQQGGVATLSLMMYFLSSDGTAAPLTSTSAVALPSLTLSEGFTLGPAKINGAALTELTSLRIRFNYGVKIEAFEGNDYPRYAYYDTFAPEITVSTRDPVIVESLGLGGFAQNGTPSIFYLRRKTPGGGNVANGTATHIKLTMNAGFFRPDPAGDTDGDPSTADLVAHATDDGTNPVLAINTATTIA